MRQEERYGALTVTPQSENTNALSTTFQKYGISVPLMKLGHWVEAHCGGQEQVRQYFSPDCRYIARNTMSRCEIQLCDMVNGDIIKRYPARLNTLIDFYINFEKNIIAVAYRKEIDLISIDKGEILKTFTGFNIIEDVIIGCRGKYLAVRQRTYDIKGDNYNPAMVEIVEINSGRKKTFKGHTMIINEMCLSENEKYLATGGGDKTALVFDIESGVRLASFDKFEGSLFSVSLGRDGNFLATGSVDKFVKVWDVKNGECKREFAVEGYPDCVMISNDNKLLAAVILTEGGPTLSIWDIEADRVLLNKKIEGFHESEVFPEGLWNQKRPDCMKYLRRLPNACHVSYFSIEWNMKYMSVNNWFKEYTYSEYRQSTKMVDINSGECIAKLPGFYTNFYNDDTYLSIEKVNKSHDEVRLIDRKSGEELKSYRVAGDVKYIDKSNELLITREMLNQNKETVKWRLYRISTGRIEKDYVSNGLSIRFHPFPNWNCRYIIYIKEGGPKSYSLYAYDFAFDRTLKIHEDTVMIKALCFDDTGRYLAVGCGDNTIGIWDIESRERLIVLSGHNKRIVSLAFDEERKKLISGSDDNTAILWDLESKNPLAVLPHRDSIWMAAFVPGSRIVVTGSDDYTTNFWDVESGKLIITLYNTLNGFLWTVPGDEAGANGWFYTNCPEMIHVYRTSEDGSREILGLNDPERIDYIKLYNRKDIVMSRLNNYSKYQKLVNGMMQKGMMISSAQRSNEKLKLLITNNL